MKRNFCESEFSCLVNIANISQRLNKNEASWKILPLGGDNFIYY